MLYDYFTYALTYSIVIILIWDYTITYLSTLLLRKTWVLPSVGLHTSTVRADSHTFCILIQTSILFKMFAAVNPFPYMRINVILFPANTCCCLPFCFWLSRCVWTMSSCCGFLTAFPTLEMNNWFSMWFKSFLQFVLGCLTFALWLTEIFLRPEYSSLSSSSSALPCHFFHGTR